MVRLLRSVPYLIGLALDGVGFLLTVVALRSLPLFVVEAFTAGALAVTAVAAATWLKIPLSRRGVGRGADAAVVAGLVALGLSAGEGDDVTLSMMQKWLPLGVGSALLLLTFLGAKVPGRLGVTLLGALAGFGFGLVGIATRTLTDPISVTGLLKDPSAYGIVVAGAVALSPWPPPCNVTPSPKRPPPWWSLRRSFRQGSDWCSWGTGSGLASRSSQSSGSCWP